MKDDILIFGSGNQAKVTIDIIELLNVYEIAGLIDIKNVNNLLDYPVLGTESDLIDININKGIIAIGNNWLRSQVNRTIINIIPSFSFINAIHPSAILANNVKIGNGSQIMAGVVINSSAIIGSHSLINTNSSIDHDCIISKYCSINPGVALGGHVTVGEFSSVGIGSSVIHDINIGKHTNIGAGSNVVKNIPSNVLAYGNPCTVRRERAKDENLMTK